MFNNLDIKTEYTRMLNNLVVQNYHKHNKKKSCILHKVLAQSMRQITTFTLKGFIFVYHRDAILFL